MSTMRKTITVTDQQGSWIKAQIEAGEYTNDSEYIRDLIRQDQARKAELLVVREKLVAAEASGISDKTPEDIRTQVKQRLKKNGQL